MFLEIRHLGLMVCLAVGSLSPGGGHVFLASAVVSDKFGG